MSFLRDLRTLGYSLRPLLLIAVAETLALSFERVEPVASALEFLHTYSLIHDDLPAMDDDDIRRGQPSLHRAFDEAIAILTGDFLLTESFTILAELPDPFCRAFVSLFGRAASGSGMIGGQLADISRSPKTTPDLLEMYRKKTGLLFELATRTGAVLANLSQEDEIQWASFGCNIGIAFQILDDIEDRKTDSYSLLTFIGVEEAKKYARDLLLEAKKGLSTMSHTTRDLTTLHSLLEKLFSSCR